MISSAPTLTPDRRPKPRLIFAGRWIVTGAALVCILLAFAGCGSSGITVAPKPVAVHQVSDWARINVISADGRGVLVTTEWVRVYHELLTIFGSKLPVSNRPAGPNDGINPEGSNFRVTYEVSDRFADLKYFERNGSP